MWEKIIIAVIFLTFSAKAADDEAACSVDANPAPSMDWMEKLNRSIGATTVTEETTPAAPVVVEEPVEQPLDDDPVPAEKYAMKEPLLSRVIKAAHAEAELPRKRHGRMIRNPAKGKGWCYRAVKHILARAGLVESWWAESPARKAHENGTLKAKGFKDIKSEGYDTANAPIGAILVYAGGPAGSGHIEVRTSRYEYCSDYCAARPLDQITKSSRKPRRLIGVYVKE